MKAETSEEITTLARYMELKQGGFLFLGQSYLFWEYVRILNELRENNPNVLFLLENVEMGKKWESVIDNALGTSCSATDGQFGSSSTYCLSCLADSRTQQQKTMKTSIKVKLRPSTVEGREGHIQYQIIRNREARLVSAGCHLYPHEFDVDTQQVIVQDGDRREATAQAQARINCDLRTLENICKFLVQRFTQKRVDGWLKLFMEKLIARKKAAGKQGTARNYATALRNFMRFRGDKDTIIDDITPQMIEDYEAWMRARGVERNTTSFYMRILRTTYYRAVEAGLAEDKHPFRHVYTGVAKTVKRAVPLDIVKKLKHLNIQGLKSKWTNKRFRESATERMEKARDLFLFSFYTRGMSFVDMAFLRKSDVRNGFITYKRQKTGQKLTIRYEKQMQEIVRKYNNEASPYLLPIISDAAGDTYKEYRAEDHRMRACLYRQGKAVGSPHLLTMYAARHTWATAMRDANVPLSVISSGMGHDSEATTQIYLAQVDTGKVDEANYMLIGMI